MVLDRPRCTDPQSTSPAPVAHSHAGDDLQGRSPSAALAALPPALWSWRSRPGGASTLLRARVGALKQASLRSRERFWDIRFPKIDSIFDNSWCPGRPGHPAFRHNIASSLRLHTGLPYDWTPRSDAPLGSPLAPSARRVSRVASRLPGTTRLRFALHSGQRPNTCPSPTRPTGTGHRGAS